MSNEGGPERSDKAKWAAVSIVAICAALIVAIVVIFKADFTVDIKNYFAKISRGSVTDRNTPMISHVIRSDPDDYVTLRNETPRSIDMTNYTIVVDKRTFPLPAGTTMGPGTSLNVYFFSRRKPENLAKAQRLKEEGKIVCDSIGIARGEKVELKDPQGIVLDQKVAD